MQNKRTILFTWVAIRESSHTDSISDNHEEYEDPDRKEGRKILCPDHNTEWGGKDNESFSRRQKYQTTFKTLKLNV